MRIFDKIKLLYQCRPIWFHRSHTPLSDSRWEYKLYLRGLSSGRLAFFLWRGTKYELGWHRLQQSKLLYKESMNES